MKIIDPENELANFSKSLVNDYPVVNIDLSNRKLIKGFYIIL